MTVEEGLSKLQKNELMHYGRKGMKWYQHIFGKENQGSRSRKKKSKKKKRFTREDWEAILKKTQNNEKFVVDLGPTTSRDRFEMRFNRYLNNPVNNRTQSLSIKRYNERMDKKR